MTVPITFETRAGSVAKSASWSNPANALVDDGSVTLAGPLASRQFLFLGDFRFAVDPRWRLAEWRIENLRASGPAGECLYFALGREVTGMTPVTPMTPVWQRLQMTGSMANLGPVAGSLELVDLTDFARTDFGLWLMREPATSGTVQIDYVDVTLATQRWNTVPMWQQPEDDEDARGGRLCSASKIWFPGSMLQETERGLRGEPFGEE